jgi:hypothetical protein
MIDFTTVKNLASKFTVTGAQKAHIDRLVFELGILEKEVTTLSLKLVDKDLAVSELEAQLADLTSKNNELQSKLDDFNHVTDWLNEEEAKILHFFFQAQESSCPAAAMNLRIPLPEVMHHVGSLLKSGFLRQSKASAGPSRPATFRITHAGSAQTMKKS